MPKKQFIITIDSETTITDKIADFGATITDSKGNIHAQCGILVRDFFGIDPLFYDKNASGIWSSESVARRTEAYHTMLQNGTRMMASVQAITRWLEKAAGKYNPTLTAYNLAFDVDKCQKSGIDLNMFSSRFCLWAAAVGNICNTKAYKEFVLQNHRFNNVTDKGNMTFKTDAETVAGFLAGKITEEPHTALEDIIGFELPILTHVIKKRKWKDKVTPYVWSKHQVKDHYHA
jgi:hypothetical protein